MNDTLVTPTCPTCGGGTLGARACTCNTLRLNETVPRLLTTLHPDGAAPGDAAMPATQVEQTIASQLPLTAPGDPAARIGLRLGGRYRLDAVLGQGGFGTVYRATHLAIDEPVAVKFLRDELAMHHELRARLRREAKALARLRHPNIVGVLDYDEHDGAPYIVMELVRGVTLESQLCVDGRTLPLARVAAIFDALLHGLEAAHAAGVVHRDMKPENVLLLPDEGLKILDFGIALMAEPGTDARLTATGVIQGTPLYMAPEQCRGRDVGPRADIYSVGVMLFSALAGEPPFAGDSATDLMVKHMFLAPPALHERGTHPQISPAIEAVVQRALAKLPDDRPDATTLRHQLAAAFAGRDPVSHDHREQARRQQVAHLSRSERALPAIPEPAPGGERMPDDECVALWDLPAARTEALAAALAIHGLRPATTRELPPAELHGRRVRIVILDERDAAARTLQLRNNPATARVPILVVDLADVARTPELIRAGASDVGLAQIGDEAVCAKLRRMLRRGR